MFFDSEQAFFSDSEQAFLSEEQALAFDAQQDALDLPLVFFATTVVALKEPPL